MAAAYTAPVLSDDRTNVPGATVYLDARRVLKKSDIHEVWQYAWSLVATPYGSEATLAYNNLFRASFVPDVPGRYLVQLEVTALLGVSEFTTYVLVDEDLRVADYKIDNDAVEQDGTSWTFQGFTESQWEAMAS